MFINYGFRESELPCGRLDDAVNGKEDVCSNKEIASKQGEGKIEEQGDTKESGPSALGSGEDADSEPIVCTACRQPIGLACAALNQCAQYGQAHRMAQQ